MGAAASRQTIIAGAVARFDAIGSQEIARHLGVALDRSAMKARDRFRVSMRQVLGRSPTGARALLGGVALSAYTVNVVNYRPIQFRDGMGADDLSTEVYVNSSQGTRESTSRPSSNTSSATALRSASRATSACRTTRSTSRARRPWC